MSKLNAIIIDDEQGSIRSLEWELENYADDVHIVSTTTSPIEGIRLIRSLQPDLVFLDIEMPKMNGFDLLKELQPIQFDVIFTTAYDKFAVRAFEVSAVDYLLKPVDEVDLGRAIMKMKERGGAHLFQKKMEFLFENLQQRDPKFKSIVLPTIEGLEFIEADQIIRCESDGNYTRLFFLNGTSLFVSKTLKEIERLLDGMGFYRIHHSHLVNIRCIKKYKKGKAGSLILKDGSTVPVSRSRKGDFFG